MTQRLEKDAPFHEELGAQWVLMNNIWVIRTHHIESLLFHSTGWWETALIRECSSLKYYSTNHNFRSQRRINSAWCCLPAMARCFLIWRYYKYILQFLLKLYHYFGWWAPKTVAPSSFNELRLCGTSASSVFSLFLWLMARKPTTPPCKALYHTSDGLRAKIDLPSSNSQKSTIGKPCPFNR